MLLRGQLETNSMQTRCSFDAYSTMLRHEVDPHATQLLHKISTQIRHHSVGHLDVGDAVPDTSILQDPTFSDGA